ncbi:MAG: molecular chaperone HtpG, partial [Candidatus Methanomethylophilaceae archaeon]|nr:molecular chaperone HtpG [Candidatus Methanomethylophilaceae archaeon]
RELISNASDAIDKINYKIITEPTIPVDKKDLKISVKVDKANRTITVSDNGIGMNKDEMEQNLGVIAHSGSLDFKTALEEGADSDIIGQFGVGFYSAFMVSDNVKVFSKPYGSETGYLWESDGVDGYTIKECQKDGFGTDIVLHIKKDESGAEDYDEFLESYRLQDLIKTYSDYIRWPIHMDVESGSWEETGEKDEEGNPKKDYVTKIEDKVINSMVPVWQKKKSKTSDEEAKEFYKTKFHDYEEPMSIIRVNAEGTVSYKAMLFIPSKAPYDFYTREYEPGLQLYSAGVMIMEKCADILPYCFRFVRGVVDSPDFSLNISREILQHDRQLKQISSNLTKKIKAELEKMMKDEPEKYEGFYKSFGRQLKYGIVDEYGSNKDLLKDLVMFHSAKKKKLISLAEYVKDMEVGQDRIYYVSADTVENAEKLPQAEPVLDKGYDFLCLTEDVDEFVMKTLRDYEEKNLCNITTDDLGIESDEEKKEVEEKQEENKDVLSYVKEVLGDRVKEVKISSKLKNHAVMLSTEGGISIEMEKYFRSMPDYDGSMKASYVLELNASHPAFQSLCNAVETDKERAEKMALIMFDQAML